MDIKHLDEHADGNRLDTDLLIIGGGAAGLSIAREFFNTQWSVLIVESGDIDQTDEHESLNEVTFESSAICEDWRERRHEYHSNLAKKWSGERQAFGARCRGLGGSTAAWAGKSAPFAPHDYLSRAWLPYSGWPFTHDDLAPYVRRAEEKLNLGVGAYGDDFWELHAGKGRRLDFDPDVFSSFFWQFARSRINPVDMMRMGEEFTQETADNVRVLLNATATDVRPRFREGEDLVEVDLKSLNGASATVSAKKVVVACGALENARLLLASTSVHPNGLGNDRDQVGRYLMDHLHASLGDFEQDAIKTIGDRFGALGLSANDRVDMYMHGIGLNLPIQEKEGLVNAGAYCVSERAANDPWAAVARLLRRQSDAPLSDAWAIASAPRQIVTGAGRLFLQHERVPTSLRKRVVDLIVQVMPNFVVEEYQTEGLPHKLVNIGVDCLVEQEPLPDNRVVLSDKKNRLGESLPHVIWEPGEKSLRTLQRMGELVVEQFTKAELPAPILVDWIQRNALDEASIIETAHTCGTTRMSDNELTGAVDENCKLRHCEGVYVAGGSVLPTCSHTNSTLQLVSVALRLADHLKLEFERA